MLSKGASKMTTSQADLRFVPGREIRVIPRGWQHPRREGGRYQPLLPAGYAFDDDQERWPQMPDASRLPEGETEIAAYEAVSEGTPISPAFPNTPEGRRALVGYCAEHCTTFGRNRGDAEAWAAILFGDAAVTSEGAVIAEA
jgi:hypothetical protein